MMSPVTPSKKTKTGRRELTDADKARIASLAATGISYGQITAELNIPRSTVRDFLRRVNDRGHYENKPRSGRPRKTTAQIDDLIIRDKEASLQDIQLRVVPNVSLRTIKRRIREAELTSEVPAPGSERLSSETKDQNVGLNQDINRNLILPSYSSPSPPNLYMSNDHKIKLDGPSQTNVDDQIQNIIYTSSDNNHLNIHPIDTEMMACAALSVNETTRLPEPMYLLPRPNPMSLANLVPMTEPPTIPKLVSSHPMASDPSLISTPNSVTSPGSVSLPTTTISSDMTPATTASLQSMKLASSSSSISPTPLSFPGSQPTLIPISPMSPAACNHNNPRLEALCPPHEKMFVLSMDIRNIWNTELSFQSALNLLPMSDQPAIERLSFRHDAKMALASQLLRRYVVAVVMGTKWLETPILKTAEGRPYVPGVSFDFNISHMSGFAVVAVRLDSTPVGVDVACFTPPEDWAEGWLQGFRELFSPAEFSEILADGKDAKYSEMQLAHRWALKEAYTKALGIGLVTDLSLIEFRNVKLVSKKGNTWYGDAELWVKGTYQNWKLELFLLEDDLIVAIATPRAGLNPSATATPFKSIRMEDISKVAVTQYF